MRHHNIFDTVPEKIIKRVRKAIKVRVTGSEKRHIIALLGYTTAGDFLPSMSGPAPSFNACFVYKKTIQQPTTHTILTDNTSVGSPNQYHGQHSPLSPTHHRRIAKGSNEGQCKQNRCKYQHTCSACQGVHTFLDCPSQAIATVDKLQRNISILHSKISSGNWNQTDLELHTYKTYNRDYGGCVYVNSYIPP